MAGQPQNSCHTTGGTQPSLSPPDIQNGPCVISMCRFHNNEKRKDNAFLLPDGSVVRGREVAATRLDTQLGRDQLEEFCRWGGDQSTKVCPGLSLSKYCIVQVEGQCEAGRAGGLAGGHQPAHGMEEQDVRQGILLLSNYNRH